MFKELYSEDELNQLKANINQRRGWNFSQMNTVRQPVPWKYHDVIEMYLKPKDMVLDVGTGGGENFLKFAHLFRKGIGIDVDPEMVKIANENSLNVENVIFEVDNQHLEKTKEKFDVVLNRHAPFDLTAVSDHLVKGGYFITQQVGERNMLNIKRVLNSITKTPVITVDEIKKSELKMLAFMEYDVEYIVKDVDSLIFWLHALDMLHADLAGGDALEDVYLFNKILEGNVDSRGFITNEHRYLAIAQK